MNTIQELEHQLRLAKEKEETESLLKEFEERKSFYEGKAFASHKLASSRHATRAFYFTMTKLCNFRSNNGESCSSSKYLYDKHNISITKDDKGNLSTNYSIYKQDAIDSFRGHSYLDFRKDHTIPVKQFDAIWEQSQASKEVIFDVIRGLFKTEDYITGGDYTTESNEIKYLTEAQVPLIDLSTYNNKGGSNITVLEILSWQHHPFLVAKQLINNKYSKQITESILQKMSNDAYSWGGSILERDLPRITMLKAFITSVKWLE